MDKRTLAWILLTLGFALLVIAIVKTAKERSQ